MFAFITVALAPGRRDLGIMPGEWSQGVNVSSPPVYLKPNVVGTPLLNRWCIRPPLIPPPWAAMEVTKINIPIMESYIAQPEMHQRAASSPKLVGGPWMN